jgi:hypothetical protein
MPDLDLIKHEKQGARDRCARFAKGRSGNPDGRPRLAETTLSAPPSFA